MLGSSMALGSNLFIDNSGKWGICTAFTYDNFSASFSPRIKAFKNFIFILYWEGKNKPPAVSINNK
jgi:hypothetical protein